MPAAIIFWSVSDEDETGVKTEKEREIALRVIINQSANAEFYRDSVVKKECLPQFEVARRWISARYAKQIREFVRKWEITHAGCARRREYNEAKRSVLGTNTMLIVDQDEAETD